MQSEQEKLAEAAARLLSIAGTLQYQVLNNLDTHAGQARETVDPKALDAFVKRPIMQSVTSLKSVRLQLLKLASNGRLNNTNSDETGG